MGRRKAEIMPILASTYGREAATKWWAYWRVFFIACAELWAFRNGEEWFVSHYLFTKNKWVKSREDRAVSFQTVEPPHGILTEE